MTLEPTLGAVFLTGLLGGVHCAGMCGGIVGALSLAGSGRTGGRAARSEPPGGALALVFVPPSAAVPSSGADVAPLASRAADATRALVGTLATLLPYNLGRLATYTALGAAAGAAGSVGWLLGEALPAQQIAFALTNLLLVLVGLHVAGNRRVGRLLEVPGAPLWQWVRPLATRALGRPGAVGACLAGGLWGLVPCGMVYAVLVAALLSGGALEGAALMLAFGLGTLPNLLALGLAGRRFGALARCGPARRMAGLAIVAFGLLGLARLDVAERLPLIGELCARLPSP